MRLSVIVTTYNQPATLERVLWGYATQAHPDFQLVVADDGSGRSTAELISKMRASTGLDLLHVWHEDRGFRKTEILNRAIVASAGEYLIFSDGDCIPRDDFVAVHLRHADRGRFLSGGYLKLPPGVSESVTAEDIRAGRATDPEWLARRGYRGWRARARLTRSILLATALDAITPTRPTWNGHNASAWRADICAVNGFDTDMTYGGLDRAFGERLNNYGVTGKGIRFRAPCLHLHHERPYVDPERLQRNEEFRRQIRAKRIVRAERGIEELETVSQQTAPSAAAPPFSPGAL
jgi:glycosyltransferase involved in cell wall biosynthesis